MKHPKHPLLTAALVAVLAATAVLPSAAAPAGSPSMSAPAAGPCLAGGGYDPACDVNHNGVVDILDVQLTAGHWNQSGVFTSGGWDLTGNLIVVQGLAQVKVAQGEALAPGQRLKASDAAGRACGLRTVEVDGVTLDEGGPTVGVALDAAEDGMVWAMVALQ